MRIQFGQAVECADGACGTVADVVIDPLRRVATHVVVAPRHNHHLARLVPIGVFERRPGTTLRVTSTAAELARYPEIEETAYLRLGEWPTLEDGWDVGIMTVLSPPYSESFTAEGGYRLGPDADRTLMAYDRIPAGEVEMRRGSVVHTADGREVGHVGGVVAGPDGRVTDLVLERGHLWGRREVTVPIVSVREVTTDRVELDLHASQVDVLPWVRVHRDASNAG